MDWKSCWSNTLSLAAGHKAHTEEEREREKKENDDERSNSIGGNKGVEGSKERWNEQIDRKKGRKNSKEDVNKDGKRHQRRSKGGEKE